MDTELQGPCGRNLPVAAYSLHIVSVMQSSMFSLLLHEIMMSDEL